MPATTSTETETKKMTNFDWIKEKIRPNAVDAFEIFNTRLCSKKKRTEVARELFGDPCQCRLCSRPDGYNESDCPYSRLSLGNCRTWILKWMELPVGETLSEDQLFEQED